MKMIYEVHLNSEILTTFLDKYGVLGAKINKFIQHIEEYWKLTRKPETRNL
jgi:hypothetical protein